MTGTLDASEPIADLLFVDGIEPVIRRVHVRWHNGEPERYRIVVELPQLVGVVHYQRQVRRHEGCRVVRLEIRGLIRDQRVGGGVRLVEAVAGKLFHQIEELRSLRFRQPILLRSGNEDIAVLGHLLLFLLAHRPPQQVGAAQGVATDHLRDLHHLFLIHHHTVGWPEDRFQPRIEILDKFGAGLAPHVIGNELHRPWPV